MTASVLAIMVGFVLLYAGPVAWLCYVVSTRLPH